MKQDEQYDEKYKVNGENIFTKSRKDLKKILEDFPDWGDIIDLVFELRSLYFFKILFYNVYVYTQIGIRIEYDLNLMKQDEQYDEKYKVNGENIFTKSRKDLKKILEDFPDWGDIIDLVFELRGLYFFKILFYNVYVYTQIGIRIEYDLNLMKQDGQYDEKYKVNGENIFTKSRKNLKKILEDFPDWGDIIDLVFELRGLYFFKILFYNNANVYT